MGPKIVKMKRTQSTNKATLYKIKGGGTQLVDGCEVCMFSWYRLVVVYLSPCSEGGVVDGCTSSPGCNIDGGGVGVNNSGI